jgi:pimeloyl-ACP methyl ester carboxylesterase
MTATLYHKLPDGRKLAYCFFGDPAGYPLIYAHGLPGSRLEAGLYHEAARAWGFRLIAVDRPGIGGSSPHPKRTLSSTATDLKSLANTLNLETFGVFGWCGGGGLAMACARRMPDRVAFVLTSSTPTNPAELHYAAGQMITPGNGVYRPRRTGLWFWRLHYLPQYWLLNLAPMAYLRHYQRIVEPGDRALLQQPEAQRIFLAAQKEAFRQGVSGVALDQHLLSQDWGFRLDQVTTRLVVFHGTDDRLISFDYGSHLARTVPDGMLHEYTGEGHFLPLRHAGEIFQAGRMILEAG